jgi:hypothetical protein
MWNLKNLNLQKQRAEWWLPGAKDGQWRDGEILFKWYKFQLCRMNKFWRAIA